MTTDIAKFSKEFLWRRIHSLMGFWLVLYLAIHLLTNSQAGLWIGDDGHGFIRLVNSLERLPYLQVIEIALIGIPLLLHGVWGIKRALQAKQNDRNSNGNAPSIKTERNRAFSWQRITSWILLVGIIFHVAQMRFIDAPKKVMTSVGESYFIKLSFDEGLYTLGTRLRVGFFTPSEVKQAKEELMTLTDFPATQNAPTFNVDDQMASNLLQNMKDEKRWLQTLTSYSLKENDLIGVTTQPGTAYLLMVRDTFKNPVMALLYTIFLLATVFHAANGFWTFLITWGIILSYRSQKMMIPYSVLLMALLAFLGLVAIWCSYFINLRH